MYVDPPASRPELPERQEWGECLAMARPIEGFGDLALLAGQSRALTARLHKGERIIALRHRAKKLLAPPPNVR